MEKKLTKEEKAQAYAEELTEKAHCGTEFTTEEIAQAYLKGYNEGHNDAYGKGFSQGHKVGYKKGYHPERYGILCRVRELRL